MADIAFRDGVAYQMTQADKDGLGGAQAAFRAPPTKDELKARAATKRLAIESGSTTISGFLVGTDRDSKANLTGAALGAQLNPQLTLPWKLADGTFVTLTATQVVGLAQGVMAYVATLFGKEQAIDAQIDAGTITTFDQVDAAFTAS